MYPLTSDPNAAQAIARQMIEERVQQAGRRAQGRAARNQTRREAHPTNPSSTHRTSAWASRMLHLAH
jgi:hypothetical protein